MPNVVESTLSRKEFFQLFTRPGEFSNAFAPPAEPEAQSGLDPYFSLLKNAGINVDFTSSTYVKKGRIVERCDASFLLPDSKRMDPMVLQMDLTAVSGKLVKTSITKEGWQFTIQDVSMDYCKPSGGAPAGEPGIVPQNDPSTKSNPNIAGQSPLSPPLEIPPALWGPIAGAAALGVGLLTLIASRSRAKWTNS